MSVRVPMRHLRFVTRRPYIEIDGPVVRLRIPSVFGEVWSLNTADVAVVADLSAGGDDPGDDWIFQEPVGIPYAGLSRFAQKPNLMLLFKKRQRIPPLRFLAASAMELSQQASRSSGIHFDGLRLRVREPQAAAEALAAAGIERVDSPNA